MANVASVLAAAKKQNGPAIGDFGTKLHPAERIPSGIFDFDMATGGGIPRGKITEVFGPNSSGKTNLCLKLVGTHQTLFPELTCAYFDLEHALDGVWANKMGVDTDKLLWMKPEYVEQVVDMVEGFLAADDIGLIVLDSLAAMITFNEASSDASKAAVGGTSNPIGKLIRKITLRLTQAEKEGRFPTVVCVNQIRFKIGAAMHTDPEITPGGEAPKFAAGMRVRTYGKNIMDSKVSTTMPVRKQTQFILRKWKCDVISANGQYEMAMIPHSGLGVGECDDVNAVISYMKKCGALTKGTKTGTWDVMGETYKGQDPIKERLVQDKLWGLSIRSQIIKTMLAGGELPIMEDEAA